ncbi:Transcription initiation factor IIB [Colletotrichum orbiculare MAFF 240422]|uniref:Transcription initiation factor IIB n=1 Tax=Colletotrichum orbiculare (strain 104-T / ATCC 96160 / CBS 514.97 / LARS 414 / MAFF 240422) TaxID=1213857 RepID=A0A484FT04_COLOR|nr:Transcription initiation factor IIB [Colletotrichum orbiculare MAFF 240422]
MSAVLFYIFDRRKSRQFREACKRDPYLTRKEFSRRRKLSAVQRLEEEEMQRNIMIRKSLASRSTSRVSSEQDYEAEMQQYQHHQSDRLMPVVQRGRQAESDRYNEWAPSERRSRADSDLSSQGGISSRGYAGCTEPHPGVEVEIPLPPRSRTPSPDRTPLIRRDTPPMSAGIYGEDGEVVARPSDVHKSLQFVRANTVKLHSPLFVQLTNDRLWTQTYTERKEQSDTHRAVVHKRQELRRRKKELKRRRKVFDEINNIYTPKPYKPKMLGTNGSDENANAEGFRDDLNMVVMCPDCKEYPPNLVEEFSSGDMVCGSCGLVVGERIIDTRSEWRTFANDDQGNDDPSRVGDSVNPLLNGSQLETSIAFGDGRDAKQLARLQNKSQNDKASKSLMQAYKEIGAFCDSINLGKNVSDAAKHIFKLTYDHNFMKGKPQEAVIAGCIFIACRQTGVGRTFREIFQVTHVSKKEIGRVFKQLESFLQKIKEENPRGAGSLSNLDGYKASASTSAEDLCTRFCSNLNFRNAQKIENVSRALARKTSSVSELAGRSPLSVAAACIYMASHLMKEPRTSKEIASVAGVSDGTIKTAYRFLYQSRDSLIDKEFGADKKAIEGLPVN